MDEELKLLIENSLLDANTELSKITNDVIHLDGVRLTVLSMEGKRVGTLLLSRGTSSGGN